MVHDQRQMASVTAKAQIENKTLGKRSKGFSHRTRTGCSVCRQRRVKCDESRPRCRKCIITGRQCPGYLDSRPIANLVGTSVLGTILPQIGGSEDSQDLSHLLPSLIRKQTGRGRFNQIIPFMASMYSNLLPSRAGHNFVLDAAMRCTANGIRELLRNGYARGLNSPYFIAEPASELTRSYTTAVAALRHSLDNRRLSSEPEILLAAMLLCSFETLKENSDERVQMHMHGLTKIYEHRGLPPIDSQIERSLIIGCIVLTVNSCYWCNAPSFWSQQRWSNIILQCRDDKRTDARIRWLLDNWRLHAIAATLLYECSDFILNKSNSTPGYNERRRQLLVQIHSAERLCTKHRNVKVKELSDNDPEATICTVYEKLSQTREGRSGYPINYLSVFSHMRTICSVLRVALGGKDIMPVMENVLALVAWLQSFEARQKGDFEFTELAAAVFKATIVTSSDWRNFAAETEESADEGRIQVVEPLLFRRWLVLSGITPHVNN